MSLNTAFSIAQKGILSLEQQIGVVSNNINNANKAGYTRKAYDSQSIVASGYTIPSKGQAVQATINDALVAQVNTQATSYNYSQTLADYMSVYSDTYGGTAGSATTLSTTIDNFTASLQALESDPTQISDKSKIISDAQQIASSLNSLSNALQNQRQQASDSISSTISNFNDNLQTIYDLNRQIVNATAQGQSAADLVDERNTALNNLSQIMTVNYTTTSDNQVTVSAGGVNLIAAGQISKLSYTPVGGVSASTVYPGGFSGINVNGADITPAVSGGTLGALITLRDSTLPSEQNKLNAFATTLSNTVNNVLAAGTSYPAQNTVTGTTAVTSATTLSGTGNWRVAVTDSTGAVQSVTDLNLASYSTVGALVTALNGISGVSASVASGVLTVTSTNSSYGISLNQMNSAIGGKGATAYFGFNNLFVGNSSGLTASNITVNSVLKSNASALATSTLSSGALSVGATGITSGDTTIASNLVSAMNTAQAFAAAGNFSSMNTTLSSYSSLLISDAATQAASAKTTADTASSTYSYLTTQLSSETGVNVDEESANLSQLQNYYASTANVLSVIKDLYTTLLEAYR